MSQPNAQQDNNDILYILGALLVVGFLAKMFLGDSVLQVHLFLRHLWVEALRGVGLHTAGLEWAHTAYQAYDLSEWTPAKLSLLSKVARWVAFPVLGGILAYYGWRVINANPASKFKRVFNMKTLAQSESREWPWMLPFMDVDLVGASISEGPYAMAMTELEFARHYRLLSSDERLTLDVNRAEMLFASQLGRLWEGFNHLRRHERALLGCFMAQLCGEGKVGRQACVEGLELLTRSFVAGQLDVSRSDAFIEQYRNHPRVLRVLKRHAYVSTVMCGLLAEARLRGKIPPSMMGWLMTHDRPLWYVIQNLGRRTPYTEGGGVYTHYMAEVQAGRRFAYPCVKPAALALAHELSKVKLAEDEGDHEPIPRND